MTYDELMRSILTAQEKMLKHKIEANSVTLNGRKYGKLIEGCPPNMKPTIFGMAVKADYALPDDYDSLVQYEPPQPITNADRIRSMTDEELDKFLGEVQWDVANYCGGVTQKQEYPVPEQRGAWLDWLRQEACDDDRR